MGLTRLLGGVTGITNQPQGLDIGISGSNIKSIQSGQLTLAATSTNVTVTSFDTTKCLLLISFKNSALTTQQARNTLVKASVVNATTINFEIDTYIASNSPTVYWQLIEFNNVKSRQSGDVGWSSINANVTINNINLNKSIVFASHKSISAGDFGIQWLVGYRLTTSTNLLLEQYDSTNKTSHWQVIEFN